METFDSSLPFPFSYPITTSSHTPTSCGITDFINVGVAPMSRSSRDTWMDSRLWSQLPQTLIDRIIAFLATSSILQSQISLQEMVWTSFFQFLSSSLLAALPFPPLLLVLQAQASNQQQLHLSKQ
ncbi:unnamed protein product [Rhodiola kirilowii]